MPNDYHEYLSASGRTLVSQVAEFLQKLDPSQVEVFLALLPTRNAEIYGDGIRAIYEPSFDEPLICTLLALGEAGLEALYSLIINGHYPSSSFFCIEILFSVRRQLPGHIIERVGFLRRYIDDAVIDSVISQVSNVYNNPRLGIKARDVIARAVQHAITTASGREILVSIFGLARDDEIEYLVELITRNTLIISDEVCDRFQELVNQDLSENVYQDYLRTYPALVDPLASSIVDSQYLANQWKTDFTIRRLDDEYIFVEIERPRDKPFNDYPAPSSRLSHALGQVLNWLVWIEDNIDYAKTHGFPSIHAPRGVVVIGRASDLAPAQARMLRALNDALYPRITVLTFDDLIVNARNVLANLIPRSDLSKS